MNGTRAWRVPGSRVASHLARAVLFGGVCAGVLLGGAAIASAEQAHVDRSSVEASVPSSSPHRTALATSAPERPAPVGGPRISAADTPKSKHRPPADHPTVETKPVTVRAPVTTSKPSAPQPARPAAVAPAKPAEARPAPPAKARPAAPAQPAVSDSQGADNANTTASSTGKTRSTESASASESHGNSSTNSSTDANAQGNASSAKKLGVKARPELPPQHQQADLPESNAVQQDHPAPNAWTTSFKAQPRAPNAPAHPTSAPLSPPGNDLPPASPSSTFGSAAGGSVNELRSAHCTVPVSPDRLTAAPGGLVAQRDIDPDVTTRSNEPAASPD